MTSKVIKDIIIKFKIAQLQLWQSWLFLWFTKAWWWIQITRIFFFV